MTPAQAAAALFQAMPRPITISQLEEYGIEIAATNVPRIARELIAAVLGRRVVGPVVDDGDAVDPEPHAVITADLEGV